MKEQQKNMLSLNQAAFTQCTVYIDGILKEYQSVIGRDYQGYLNHCKRVAACCLILCQDQRQEVCEKIAIAVAFHDIGIWTAKTIDYIEPSVEEMHKYLTSNQLLDWQEEITLMISEHHKLTITKCLEYPLVEHFRQADYADFSFGFIRSGIPMSEFKKLTHQFPNAGFHKALMALGVKRLFKKPWSPLPMFKW